MFSANRNSSSRTSLSSWLYSQISFSLMPYHTSLSWISILDMRYLNKIPHNLFIFKSRELLTTDTELSAIADPAIIGLSSQPV